MDKAGSRTLGIICLATDEYKILFKEFHNSFKAKFVPEYQKTFYLFTDDINIAEGMKDVVAIPIEHLEWPNVTLNRFHYIIQNKTTLKDNEYLCFCNINLICNKTIKAKEVLPRKKRSETMSYVLQPWHFEWEKEDKPFERDERSFAYVPVDMDADYVMGSLFLGEAQSFLSMAEMLKENIEKDLLNNKIAIWHDESHLNWYAAYHKPYRLLSPEYMYPDSICWKSWKEEHKQFEKRIAYLNKDEYFDVSKIKGRDIAEK